MKVLLVEDDRETATFIERGLAEHGYIVQVEDDGRSGLLAVSTNEYDVAIFDRMLPGMDGMDVVRVMREASVETPVILLTALSSIGDRVAGLDAGADDYLVKPFAFEELHARVKALSRRQPLVSEEIILTAGDLELNRATREVSRAGQPLDLLPREYQILEYLMSNPDQVITRTMLLENVWGFSFDPKTSIVQTHVSRLRTKIDKPFHQHLITTIRGSGYVFSAG